MDRCAYPCIGDGLTSLPQPWVQDRITHILSELLTAGTAHVDPASHALYAMEHCIQETGLDQNKQCHTRLNS
jgi:hypothetical protein